MEEYTLFIHFKIKKSVLNCIIPRGPALWNHKIKNPSLFQRRNLYMNLIVMRGANVAVHVSLRTRTLKSTPGGKIFH